ncbi:hypothetical protein Glo7428_1543 [Gloeocapsa sp. PCC 7428]|uniref:hypothetical protein n=1 Tax=Gloeocapsa sp. PCC 7428 TaxID=1173026 RepID=UPI0002A5D6F7|nr:hypothetical protein [Gloeocapsa sp. PCC 7428]AFZ30104.1 hypothetical protein Glo7428_1543 [Gloeocapsa sp. PCC 7428]
MKRVFDWLHGTTFKLLSLAVVIFLIWGTLAPLETLLWWLSQDEESVNPDSSQPDATSDDDSSSTEASVNCYVVFLPGVGSYDADNLTEEESNFVDRVIESHPQCVSVRDVFPYSAANEGLVGERILAPVWNVIRQSDGLAYTVINIRNIWRMALSADPRYGTVYNRGIASAIIDRMNAASPIPPANQRINAIVMSTSGGAQVALGAVPYLEDWLNAQVFAISIGGVFAGRDGFAQANGVYHLYGTEDWIDDIGWIIFPSRWRWVFGSPFNRARRQGRYQAIETGPHEHDGDRGYFGEATVDDGTKYIDLTLEKLNALPIWSVDNPSTEQD